MRSLLPFARNPLGHVSIVLAVIVYNSLYPENFSGVALRKMTASAG